MDCKHVLAFVAVAVCGVATAADPKVENVRLQQDAASCQVLITYDLTGSPGIITVDLQTNEFATGSGRWFSIGGRHYRSLSGAVNHVVDVGLENKVYWNPDVDWQGHDLAANALRAEVRVWSTDNPPDYLALDLTTAKIHKYYLDAESLPDGIESDRWRMQTLLMRRIPARNVVWTQGSPEDEVGRDTTVDDGANLEMAHKVKLSHDYYLGVFELTQYQRMLVARGGFAYDCKFTNIVSWATRPAEYNAFSDRLRDNTDPTSTSESVRHQSGSSKTIGRLRTLSGFGLSLDLPTEAQWEFACRAGTTTALYDGHSLVTAKGEDANLSRLARYKYTVVDTAADYSCDASSGTARVGSYLPNGYGLYDMLGNVSEICLDCHSSYTNYIDEITVDPLGTAFYGNKSSNDTRYRTARGGSYTSDAYQCRCASRKEAAQVWAANDAQGIRLCYTLESDDTGLDPVSEVGTLSVPLKTGDVRCVTKMSAGILLKTDPNGLLMVVR